jgi:uncharacterized protein YqgV (UPF0045/DUF77 family)
MIIQAQVSFYPLEGNNTKEKIERFIDNLRAGGLKIESHQMGTLVSGDSQNLFDTLSRAYENAAREGVSFMEIKVSNGCPQ